MERYRKETVLPILDKTKFLVPPELTISQFVTIIRYQLKTTLLISRVDEVICCLSNYTLTPEICIFTPEPFVAGRVIFDLDPVTLRVKTKLDISKGSNCTDSCQTQV